MYVPWTIKFAEINVISDCREIFEVVMRFTEIGLPIFLSLVRPKKCCLSFFIKTKRKKLKIREYKYFVCENEQWIYVYNIHFLIPFSIKALGKIGASNFTYLTINIELSLTQFRQPRHFDQSYVNIHNTESSICIKLSILSWKFCVKSLSSLIETTNIFSRPSLTEGDSILPVTLYVNL